MIGSGAAGLNAAVQLRRQGVEDVLILTEGLDKGTSINTGQRQADLLQAGHVRGRRRLAARPWRRPTSPAAACTATWRWSRPACRARAFLHLVDAGRPVPHRRLRAVRGLQDGPRPAAAGHLHRALHLAGDVPRAHRRGPAPRHPGARRPSRHRAGHRGRGRRAARRGGAGAGRARATWRCYEAENVVYAVGGPGGLYQTSVYPEVHTGGIGVALAGGRAGAEPAGVAVRPGLHRVSLERLRHLHAGRARASSARRPTARATRASSSGLLRHARRDALHGVPEGLPVALRLAEDRRRIVARSTSWSTSRP
ncbi:MAG: hypothetical protein MZV49_00270 [Rhodopseudomonas palustris]|nr:hypothetical protein [Rhodopseudomonas palustris]